MAPATWLDAAAVAAESGHHRITVYRALQIGDLHGVQRVKHGAWRVRRACFEAWMDGQPCVHQDNLRSLTRKRGA